MHLCLNTLNAYLAKIVQEKQYFIRIVPPTNCACHKFETHEEDRSEFLPKNCHHSANVRLKRKHDRAVLEMCIFAEGQETFLMGLSHEDCVRSKKM